MQRGAGLPGFFYQATEIEGPNQEKNMTRPGNTLALETTQGMVMTEMRPDLAPGHVAQAIRLAHGIATRNDPCSTFRKTKACCRSGLLRTAQSRYAALMELI